MHWRISFEASSSILWHVWVAVIAYRTVNIYDFSKETEFESNFETMDQIFLPVIRICQQNANMMALVIDVKIEEILDSAPQPDSTCSLKVTF